MLTLIARKDGASASRRQRKFADEEQLEAAVVRWRAEGFNCWWVFDWKAGDEVVPVRQWRDGAAS